MPDKGDFFVAAVFALILGSFLGFVLTYGQLYGIPIGAVGIFALLVVIMFATKKTPVYASEKANNA